MLAPGVRLGRYEIVSALGAGGMGEVYRARDTRLGRAVALKVLAEDVAADAEQLTRFEREARATAALSHPNVLAIFDVGHEDNRAYIVFELLEGTSLTAELAAGPLELTKALGQGAQIARGLAAAHARGVVHRDLKPDNIFLTTTGIVKILDFGLARVHSPGRQERTASATSPGAVLGTASYMSPEQARGQAAGVPSDIFALGTILFEMISGRHPFRKSTGAETLTAILRDDPPELASLSRRVPKTVVRLVRRCLEKRPEDRFPTANDVAVALGALSQREGEENEDRPSLPADEERPYPGLSSFTETDSARFFGREAEIAALWAKLRRHRLLAVIGPSGVGKTSFLRAGLIAHRPTGWVTAYSTPGSSPALGIAQPLVQELAADPVALAELMQGVGKLMHSGDTDGVVSAVSRWRRQAAEALLIVDQAEELFTLNPAETQARFAALLGRLADEADVHVLLSLRDDFLFRCHAYLPLASVFHDLTPLGPPNSEALQRALVEPAARLGVHFEADALVSEMVATVERERAALPLLAFAVSRMWEERDRGRKLLTRAGYDRIGGVAGALAQHAEATLQEIGPAREGGVREIFRNLVTAEGTRSAREREELLSIFGSTKEAASVLDLLVAARLLTEYEGASSSGGPGKGEPGIAPLSTQAAHARIEIIHESLLAHWPRLVRWLAQDAEGALLRDQLRQAAHLWHDRGRKEDLLWTGQAYREYVAWRGRYAGGLSAIEESFAQAMTDFAGRQRRRRRLAGATLVAASLAVALATSTLWRRSEASRRRAQAEAQRAEASKLLALGQLQLEADPTAAVAYALKSLEAADTREARVFALRALQQGPIALVASTPEEGAEAHVLAFSPGGDRLAIGGYRKTQVWLSDGKRALVLGDHPTEAWEIVSPAFGPRGDLLATASPGDLRFYSLPDGKETFSAQIEDGSATLLRRADGFFTSTTVAQEEVIRRWSLDGKRSLLVGRTEANALDIDAAGRQIAYSLDRRVLLRTLTDWAAPPRLVGEHLNQVKGVALDPWGQWVAAIDSGEIRLWPIDSVARKPLWTFPAENQGHVVASSDGKRLVAFGRNRGRSEVRIWNLGQPPEVEPLTLRRGGTFFLNDAVIDPAGEWLVTAHVDRAAFWPLDREGSYRLRRSPGGVKPINDLAFTPDGGSLITAEGGSGVYIWPLSGTHREKSQVLSGVENTEFLHLDLEPSGRRFVASGGAGRVLIAPVGKGPPRTLQGFSPSAMVFVNAFDRTGRLVAAAPYISGPHEKVIRVWDLESGAVKVLGPLDGAGSGWVDGFTGLAFNPEGQLLSCNHTGGLHLWSVEDGRRRALYQGPHGPRPCLAMALNSDGRYLAHLTGTDDYHATLVLTDLEQGSSRVLPGFDSAAPIAINSSGTLVAAADVEGIVQVGPTTGEEPHLLLGHTGLVRCLAISPDGQWLATGGDDGTLRLWPIPKGRPFHTLPYDELIARLRRLTNVRVVVETNSPTGYRLDETGPFPGWKTTLRWQDP